MVEDATVCVFGGHISKPDRCTLIILNSKREEKVIAETTYHRGGAMASLDGEFVFNKLRLATVLTGKIKKQGGLIVVSPISLICFQLFITTMLNPFKQISVEL